MRIIRGKLKSYRFKPPKGFPSRPTTDFAKEGLFNLLDNEIDLYDLQILDLFAGTGNITYEFASREAGQIVSVDRNFKCIQFIRKFAQEHKIDEALTIIKSDVFKFVNNSTQSNDLIFADPPFDFDKYPELIQAVFEKEILKEDGLFILEHSKHVDLSGQPNFRNARNYGHIVFSFFEHIS